MNWAMNSSLLQPAPPLGLGRLNSAPEPLAAHNNEHYSCSVGGVRLLIGGVWASGVSCAQIEQEEFQIGVDGILAFRLGIL